MVLHFTDVAKHRKSGNQPKTSFRLFLKSNICNSSWVSAKQFCMDEVTEAVGNISDSMPFADLCFAVSWTEKEKTLSRPEPQGSASALRFEILCNGFISFSKDVA